MQCQICGGSPARPLNDQSMHDPAYLCTGHGRMAMAVIFTDQRTLLWCLMNLPTEVEDSPENLPQPARPLIGWSPPQTRPVGAACESGRPQFRSASWVNAFTHRATDPRKSW